MSDLTLVEFLTARYDEQEAIARAATPGPWAIVPTAGLGWVMGLSGGSACRALPSEADHIATHDPAHVLADIAAKRAIVQRVASREARWINPQSAVVLRLLAQPFADHHDYRQEWKP